MASDKDIEAIKEVREYYKKHKELFDVVCSNKKLYDALEQSRDTIRKYLDGMGYEIGSKTEAQLDPVTYVKWYPKQICQYIYKEAPKKAKKRETFLFNVEIRKDGITIYLALNNYKPDKHYKRAELHEILNKLEDGDDRLVSRHYREFKTIKSYNFATETKDHWIAYRYETYTKFDPYQSEEGIRSQFQEIFAEYQQNIYDVIALLSRHGDELRGWKDEAEGKRDK